MSTIRTDFHTSLALEIAEDIYYQRANLYYYLGKIDPWFVDDQPIEPSINSVAEDTVVRDNILYIRQVAPSDISVVAPSYKWEAGTVYDQWDHTQDLRGKPFYCVADNYSVYKCLNNNGGIPSTVEPSGNALFPFTTPDGYMWKYMYTIPKFKQRKFYSRGRMPIQRALTDAFYNKGAVEQVVVNNGGSGYTDLQLTAISINGTVTGENATAIVTAVDYLGKITEIAVTDGGYAYTAGATVAATSVQGIGASLDTVIEDGVVTDIDIIDGGYGYVVGDVVEITVGGAILTPIISHLTGEIIDVRIDDSGAGYVSAPTLTVIQSSATGVGKYGNPTAVVEAVVYEGSIVQVPIIDPGVGYPFDTATTIIVAGDGTGAVFSPVIYQGELVDVIVENSGSGYSYIKLDVVGAGEGAKITGIIAASDFLSDQSLVEQTAVRGAIYNVIVTNPGTNYSNETTISFVGDGNGAAGYPIFSNGGISKIVMTNYGQDYTYADIRFNDPNRPVLNNFVDAEVYAILPPYGGHGSNAPRELYADAISIFTLLKSDTELNLLAQDYRQYGLLKNPLTLLTNKRVNSDTYIIAFDLELLSVDDLQVDDVVVCNNKQYRIITIDGLKLKLQQLNSIFTIPSGLIYKLGQPLIQYTIVKVLAIPDINKYSGDLLYATNTSPFTPTDEQSIAIRTYIKL